MLIGDKVDNIIGVRGIGKVKADRYIDVIEYEPEMIETVLNLYEGDVQRFYMNAQCLWIMQKEGETWADRVDNSILPDQLKQEVDRMSGSTTSSMEGIYDIRNIQTKTDIQNGEIPLSEPACSVLL